MDYRKESDNSIFHSRDLFRNDFGEDFFDVIDQYPLYASPQTILRFCKIYELIKDALMVPGDFCEFGTWKGATAVFMAKIINELEPQSQRKIYVFDNFSGLPTPSEDDGLYAQTQVGNYEGNKESLCKIIKSYNLEHRIELIEGDANITIPRFFDKKNPMLVSFAYFDFDLYKPTISGWEFIKERLIKGSILAFDEGLNKELWIGEYKAVAEILNNKGFAHDIRVLNNKISRQPEVILKVE